jgi:DNA-binding NarL/FixJ family response regulator
MTFKIGIITDNVLFSDLFIPLLNKKLDPTEFYVCSTLIDLDKKIKELACDLILVDGDINNISSFEIIHFIRTSQQQKAPIWFFTTIKTEAYIHKSLVVGASKIIYKPFDPNMIVDDIVKLLINKHS